VVVAGGGKIGEMTLPFASNHSLYFAPSGDRLAVNDDRGLRVLSIWPTTVALLAAAQKFSTRNLTTDALQPLPEITVARA
jgi:hypothetical protein